MQVILVHSHDHGVSHFSVIAFGGSVSHSISVEPFKQGINPLVHIDSRKLRCLYVQEGYHFTYYDNE